MNRRIFAIILIAMTTGAGASQTRGTVSSSEGLERQLRREIDELELNRDIEDKRLRQTREAISEARQRLETAERLVEQLTIGGTPVTLADARAQLDRARQGFLLAISQKDHILYRLGIVERGIQERRTVLRRASAANAATTARYEPPR